MQTLNPLIFKDKFLRVLGGKASTLKLEDVKFDLSPARCQVLTMARANDPSTTMRITLPYGYDLLLFDLTCYKCGSKAGKFRSGYGNKELINVVNSFREGDKPSIEGLDDVYPLVPNLASVCSFEPSYESLTSLIKMGYGASKKRIDGKDRVNFIHHTISHSCALRVIDSIDVDMSFPTLNTYLPDKDTFVMIYQDGLTYFIGAKNG